MIEMNVITLLKHVRVVLTLNRQKSIGRAAETLGITQSAVTRALQRAEADLGQTLFLRHAKGVEPTPAGRIVCRYAKSIVGKGAEALNEIEDLGNVPGVLNVGAAASFIDTILPRAMARAVSRFPSMEIRLTVDSVDSLMTLLRDGVLDLLFIAEPPGVASMKDIDWVPMLTDEMNIVARSDHPLANKARVGIAELSGFKWVLGRYHDPQRLYLESVYRSKGLMLPEVAVECLSRDVALRVVKDSQLLTLAPNLKANPYYDDLQRINCRDLHWTRVAGMASRSGVKLPLGAKILMRETSEFCRLR